uniref:Uncharacterized protein n=1 Tax=Oryza glumipatula TaxID=40148 RepID=A0A0D9YBT7_9ORYZ
MAPAHAVTPHVVLLPSPGAGHVAPAAQLAARLAMHHGCTATIVMYTNLSTARNSSALASLPTGVTATALPEVSLDDLPADAHIVTRIVTVVRRSLPHLRELLLSLLGSSSLAGVTAFLTDMLCPAALAVAAELGIPRYVFFTSNLLFININMNLGDARMTYIPAVHATVPHVVLLVSPGAGHVVPAAQLAACLATHHGCTATIVTYTNLSTARNSSALASLPRGVTATALPEVSLDDLPADERIVTRIVTVVRRSLPHLRELLLSLLGSSSLAGVTAFLTDMLCPAALAVAAELGIPRYVFFTSNLLCLTTLLYTPELARTTTCECRDLPEPVVLPGCVPLHGADLIDPVQNRTNPVYQLMVELGLDYLLADGFLINTFDAMEHDTLVAFNELSDKGVYPPAYTVGPLVRSPSVEAANDVCIRWLDEQRDGSVLYVCLGSGGTLSVAQTAELAAGLEASGQRFLWVVRFPSDKDVSASYFGTNDRGDNDDPLSYLPEGFVERTKGAGLAVPLWAPQVEVLNHRAVGGFLSHCGWNSTLEAASAGVPMLAWPLFAEQRMNAVMLSSERVGLAVRMRPSSARPDYGVVPREEVASAVRKLMVGEMGAVARKKAGELRAAAEMASAPGGPQHQALAEMVGKWKGRG